MRARNSSSHCICINCTSFVSMTPHCYCRAEANRPLLAAIAQQHFERRGLPRQIGGRGTIAYLLI